MSIPLDRLAALCPPELRRDLCLLSARQASVLRRKIRDALAGARNNHRADRKPTCGPDPHSEHPRAAYWREYSRERYRKRKAARDKRRARRLATSPTPKAPHAP